MTTITANLVKELRERTGSGMMECKKALETANGDIEVAIENMRKSGRATAAKKAGRIAAEGSIVIHITSDCKAALMLEINCETDFVARDQSFVDFANFVAAQGLVAKISDVNSLIKLNIGGQKTVEQAREDLVAKLGENINIRRVVNMFSEGTIGYYLHGNRIGVLVQLSVEDNDLARNVAMHIAAAKPLAVNVTDLSPELLAKEKEIYLAQIKDSGKPEAILEKMISGKVQKFINEAVLLQQSYVKDPDITVGLLLQKFGAKVLGFVRYEVGEGIEKKTVNFAEEVMSQVAAQQ
jgi:elongation factor Ts